MCLDGDTPDEGVDCASLVHILYHSTVAHEQITHAVTHRKARDNSELRWVSWARWSGKWRTREKVRCQDPRSTLFGLCASAGPAMEAAAAVLLVGRTLTSVAPPCLRTASLPRPVRPEPPPDTDGHIVFCQHEYHPAYEVLLYRKVRGASRRVELS